MASLSIYLMHRQWLKEDVPGRDIDAFLCPTSFLREKIAANGIPPDRIHVVPEFVPDPVHGTEPDRPGSGAIVVGRLSGEKGLHTLMHAWSGIDYPLTVIGTGPLLPELQRMAPANVRFADFVSDAELNEYYRKAAFMVFASECYEGFGSVLLEAMAWGKPIVATDLGGRRHIIAEEGGGLLYAPHDAADLRRKVETLISSPARIVELGRRARRRFLKEFSGEAVYGRLLACYRAAMNR
jgi:glycosyltransferase involved in cell wall biosynthesis